MIDNRQSSIVNEATRVPALPTGTGSAQHAALGTTADMPAPSAAAVSVGPLTRSSTGIVVLGGRAQYTPAVPLDLELVAALGGDLDGLAHRGDTVRHVVDVVRVDVGGVKDKLRACWCRVVTTPR